jgi:hypothetical protein
MSISPHKRPTTKEVPGEPPAEQQGGRYGLLANGSSQLWDIAVDESLDREGEWLLELDGRTTYLVFQLRDLGVISGAIAFLQRGLNTPEGPNRRLRVEDGEALTLGTFNKSTVCLLWDDESPLRCFLIIGPQARSTMRLALQRDDIEMLLEALRQVAADLPDETG